MMLFGWLMLIENSIMEAKKVLVEWLGYCALKNWVLRHD
jgi:hypothetical protein